MKIDPATWACPEQRQKLDELIRDLDIRSVIEIGSYIGASAAFFASHEQVEHVICIDPFIAEGEWASEVAAAGVPVHFYDIFRDNLKGLGLWDKINPVPGRSLAVRKVIPSADMIYVDGDHSYDGCASDILYYLPKARKVICGDDHHFDENGKPYFPGVVQACKELLPGYEHNSRMWWKVLA